MKGLIDKILERLEREIAGKPTPDEYKNGINRAYSIVQQVAEEYQKNDYMNEIQEMALELAVYVLEEEFWKYAWLENANNETGVVVTYKDAICIIKDMLKGSETDEEDI